MNKTLFRKDPGNARLTIERQFDAIRSRVWHAYTDAAMLDQWWAPLPWKTETIRMDFREGGMWLYAMNGPNGEQHFGRMEYLEIEPETRMLSRDSFADSAGTIDESLPTQTIETTFVEHGDATTVIAVVTYGSSEDLETIIRMGLEQGLTTAQDQLEALLGPN
ncbi:MAG: SRPBCC family protein [Gammaproteobacteria bacterium]